MKIAHTAVLPLLLLLIFSPAAMSSALAPSGPGAYIVFVSRADYVDSVDYDLRAPLRLLASVVGRSVALTTSVRACNISPMRPRTSGDLASTDLRTPLLRCSTAEAKAALLYHYSSIGFAARLAPEHAHRLSSQCS
ncbi:hypothetical protein ZEAMMB73_Zm00001d043572 [Zea mays]|jgi:hypothetical protein|uniref:Uncharacterized protein n=2 Tax=Zea mays TaxID=4577 RepID=A0A1D6NDD1_MAIZE|nr:hypothetical protein ZEAMMB73_Zm00001d043572 [Zea mays]